LQAFAATLNGLGLQRLAVSIEQIESVKIDWERSRVIVLQKLEGRLSLLIKGHDFTIEHEIAVNRAERFNDVWKAVVERLLVARKQRDLGTLFTAMQR